MLKEKSTYQIKYENTAYYVQISVFGGNMPVPTNNTFTQNNYT